VIPSPIIEEPATPGGDTVAAAVEVAGLCVSYGDQRVLHDVDLSVPTGGIHVIVGGSGCGKTTLLKAIIGLVPPEAGRVLLLGQHLPGLDESEQVSLRRRFGVMFQYGALLNSLTVGENVSLPLEMHTQADAALIREIVRTRLHLVGLGGTEGLLPTELSGGMRKRAALARALALDPEIIFCDEPGAGLDPVTAAEIDRLLLTLNQALTMTLVVVTHELLSIGRLGGKLLMLDRGRVVYSGATDHAQQAEQVELRRFFQPG